MRSSRDRKPDASTTGCDLESRPESGREPSTSAPPEPAPPAQTVTRCAVLAAALAATPWLASACTSPSTASAAPTPTVALVRSATVMRGALPLPLRVAGTVHPKDERALSFKVGGIISRVRVNVGDRVKRGQVLAELDATELFAGVRQAREGLTKAERDRDRARALAAEDAVPRTVADDAETAVQMAHADVQSAEFNLRRGVLTAPADGWVDERMAEPGEVAAPGRPVLQVSGRGRGFVVRASLPDREVLGLRPGQPAIIAIDARPGRQVKGAVSEIARSAYRDTGTYHVEVLLDGSENSGELVGGLTAKVEIERQVEIAAAVPLAAVVEADGAKGAVFVIDEGRARRVPVRIAFLDGERAVLDDALPGVSSVITDGAPSLADGVAVRLVP